MKFKAQDIRELRYGSSVENMESITEIQSGHSRWAVQVDFVFKHGDKFYMVTFDDPATEYQDSSPDLDVDQDGTVECDEVFPTQVTKIVYLTQKALDRIINE